MRKSLVMIVRPAVFDADVLPFDKSLLFEPSAKVGGRCPTYLLNIAKRSLPELILSGVGLASNDAVG